jgi:adenylate kinase family enzyme
VRNRLATYHDQTEVLTTFYAAAEGPKLITIDGTQSIDGVKDAISAEIDKLG